MGIENFIFTRKNEKIFSYYGNFGTYFFTVNLGQKIIFKKIRINFAFMHFVGVYRLCGGISTLPD